MFVCTGLCVCMWSSSWVLVWVWQKRCVFLAVCVVSLLCVSSEPGERLAAYSGRCGPRCAQLAWAAGGCFRAQRWEEGVWWGGGLKLAGGGDQPCWGVWLYPLANVRSCHSRHHRCSKIPISASALRTDSPRFHHAPGSGEGILQPPGVRGADETENNGEAWSPDLSPNPLTFPFQWSQPRQAGGGGIAASVRANLPPCPDVLVESSLA